MDSKRWTAVAGIVAAVWLLFLLLRRPASDAALTESTVDFRNAETGIVYRQIELPDGTEMLIPFPVPQIMPLPGTL